MNWTICLIMRNSAKNWRCIQRVEDNGSELFTAGLWQPGMYLKINTSILHCETVGERAKQAKKKPLGIPLHSASTTETRRIGPNKPAGTGCILSKSCASKRTP